MKPEKVEGAAETILMLLVVPSNIVCKLSNLLGQTKNAELVSRPNAGCGRRVDQYFAGYAAYSNDRHTESFTHTRFGERLAVASEVTYRNFF